MYKKIIDQLSKQELLEIEHRLNNYEWDDRLGAKPENWDNIPDAIISEGYTLPTKDKIARPIYEYIGTKVSKKERLKYHQLNYCGKTKFQFQIWWIKDCIQRFFEIGFYSKRTKQMIVEILEDIYCKSNQKYLEQTYNKDSTK